ncbi:peptide-methionine (S)-S-oxide reductase MsrA [Halobellus ruber]|uniref:Peptide methionine sulfoxide reductase MsrA n=1 Tax=Halobellus ruber TaxID=2761102 RepID=A0A7J9SEE5_9EURY|nr:peptide-methionine (S)-S-oxide reductase MsrA [Halobellus ruber]MBB6644902.1 peptide-methionine (S)-S-oxide reductase MsrA [Halobellus ruber]
MSDTIDGEPAELAPDAATPPPRESETATFGLGCFWGPDARFGAMDGVVRTRVGYAGGTTPSPTYRDLGDHTEVVQVEYDPAVLSYADLLDVFWANHDPRASSRTRQYRNVILVDTVAHRQAAERTRRAVASKLGGSVGTVIEDLASFTLAEPYHQKYELRSTPVLGDELVEHYGDDFVDSTVAARLNGFVAGHGDPDRRESFLAGLELPPRVLDEVRRRI